ncbi:aspartyl/asparaginyl beta-hydroxylase domain-containing protein [Flavicella sediminum]|uniref:aspartyl/asparaginyl beta-hydroxylase domain-containing protein n=1 Tax=Flavicella sediminum TaxID=2585141 RepID=UPI001121E416|nr:aspartyl/asparaginyl beta-hydroxylase domain-containing protein [Flavicella sediminum]
METLIKPKVAFHSLELYPQLALLFNNFQIFKQEALNCYSEHLTKFDEIDEEAALKVIPLRPEESDWERIPNEFIVKSRNLAPQTVHLVEPLENVKAFAFSSLKAGARITSYKGEKPYVMAMFCLQADKGVYLKNENKKQEIIEGELLIFDATMEHKVVNNSDKDRIVLLLLLDNALT